MQHKPSRHWARLLPAALALLLAGCGGGADGSSREARIRVLNVSTGYESLDLYANNGDSDTDTRHFSGITAGSVSAYAQLKGDTYTLKFRRTGTTGDLLSWSSTLADDTHSTIVAYGATNRFALLAIDDTLETPASGSAKLEVLNTTGSEAFDVYLTGASDSLDDVSATVGAVGAGAQSSVVTISSGSYRLRVTRAGLKGDLRLNVPEISLPSAGVMALILTEATGGVLVNAVLLPQKGQPVTYDNTASARLRMLNVSSGYDALDLYTTSGGSTTDVQQFAGVARGTATPYAALKADTYSLKFRRAGTTGNLTTTAATLAEERHITYVAYGATNRFAVLAIDEEISAPNSGYTKVQVLNTLGADALDVYLTGTDDALEDVSAAVPEIAAGTLGAMTTIRSGTYRLRITGSGSKTDLRLDVPQVTLQSQGVLSIVLAETTGGVLVNAVLLPQQGEPARFDNGHARVRGAVGLATGAVASISVAGAEIVTRRSARSYLGDTYTLLAAGAVPFELRVDDALVSAGTTTLEPGRDYTLLVHDEGGAARIVLVADDNRVAGAQRAKLRLLNGMSGVPLPLTLAVDYSPIAEYIEVGNVSQPANIAPGTAYRLDVSNAQTLAAVLVRESVPLAADGVYTLFVAGGGTSAVTGTLRRDR